MKNQLKEDEYIRQFITELGTEKLSPGFHKSILKRLNTKATISPYKPVISPLAWKVIGGMIATLFISVLIFVPGGSNVTPLVDQLPQIAVPSITISLPKIHTPSIHLSPIAIQSLSAFILMALITMLTSLKKWKVL